jgi:hypothetical protein
LLVLADPAWAVVIDLKPEGATGPVTLEVEIEGEPAPRTVTTDPATGTVRIEVDAGKRITVTPRDPNVTGSPVTRTVPATPTVIAFPVRPAMASRQPFPGFAGSEPGQPGPAIRGVVPWLEIGAWFGNVPRVNYGTVIPGAAGSEASIAKSDDTPTGPRFGLGVDVPVTRNGSLGLRGSFQFTDDDSSASVPVGGQNVAQVYFERFNGSGGLALGQTGADVKIETKTTQFAFDALYRHNFTPMSEVQLTGGLGIGYRRWTMWHEAEQTSPTFAGIRSEAEIDSETHIVGPIFEGGVGWRASRWLSLGLTGFVLPGWRHGCGTAEQQNVCNVCATPQRDFTLEIDEHESGFGLVGGLTGQVGVALTDRLQIGVIGGYEWTKTYAWDLPESPLEQPARLEREPTGSGRVGVFLRYVF